MPKYYVMLLGYRAKSNANRHRRETPTYLPYRINEKNALAAVDKAKELAGMYYPEYHRIEMDSVTEVQDK